MGFLDKHGALLDQARQALRARTYWSAYPEMPSGKLYGETAKDNGEAAWKALLDQPFELPGHVSDGGRLGGEVSPYGFALGITYPTASAAQLLEAAAAARLAWTAVAPLERIAIATEILARLNRQSFLMAHAAMHTTGQGFMMAFQAAGAHAQDRGLEALALAAEAIAMVPGQVRWEKATGKDRTARIDKSYRFVGRGIALLVGCSTFPTWNGYPGLFASLGTGNPVIVKPAPSAIIPLALTVRIAREVLTEAGIDPNVVQLAAVANDSGITQTIALDPRVRIIDYTGGPGFGSWLEQNARQAQVFTEKAGVNSVILESTDSFKGLIRNLSFSLALYSGQMCTAPQNLFVPSEGLRTDEGVKSAAEVGRALAEAVTRLVSDPARAAAILGALHSDAVAARCAAAALGDPPPLLDTSSFENPDYPGARSRTPLIRLIQNLDDPALRAEAFGPIAYVVTGGDRDRALAVAAATAAEVGAITASLYSTDEDYIARASDAFALAGAPLSINFTGDIYVNQSVAFSDIHASGLNPAGTAALSDLAFVAPRMSVVTIRRDRG